MNGKERRILLLPNYYMSCLQINQRGAVQISNARPDGGGLGAKPKMMSKRWCTDTHRLCVQIVMKRLICIDQYDFYIMVDY